MVEKSDVEKTEPNDIKPEQDLPESDIFMIYPLAESEEDGRDYAGFGTFLMEKIDRYIEASDDDDLDRKAVLLQLADDLQPSRRWCDRIITPWHLLGYVPFPPETDLGAVSEHITEKLSSDTTDTELQEQCRDFYASAKEVNLLEAAEDEVMPPKWGDMVFILRKNRDLSQGQLAKETNIKGQQLLARYESGKLRPREIEKVYDLNIGLNANKEHSALMIHTWRVETSRDNDIKRNTPFHVQLQLHRVNKSISRENLASRTGISATQIYYYESDKAFPDREDRDLLIKKLEIEGNYKRWLIKAWEKRAEQGKEPVTEGMPFHEQLQTHVKNSGEPLESIARKTEIAYGQLRNYMRGNRFPDENERDKLAEELNIIDNYKEWFDEAWNKVAEEKKKPVMPTMPFHEQLEAHASNRSIYDKSDTKERIADRAGIGKKTLTDYMSGRHFPDKFMKDVLIETLELEGKDKEWLIRAWRKKGYTNIREDMDWREKLRTHRSNSYDSLAYVASEAGINQDTLVDLEQGHAFPERETVEAIMRALHLPKRHRDKVMNGYDQEATKRAEAAKPEFIEVTSDMPSGKQLELHRKNQGKSLTRTAKEAGLSRQSLAFIERGERSPKRENVESLIEVLGLNETHASWVFAKYEIEREEWRAITYRGKKSPLKATEVPQHEVSDISTDGRQESDNPSLTPGA